MVKTETKKITLQETAYTIFPAYGQIENIKKRNKEALMQTSFSAHGRNKIVVWNEIT